MYFLYTAEPPRITTHPQNVKDAIPGSSAKFTVQATGTEPLNYDWQWKPAEKGSGNKEWEPCGAGGLMALHSLSPRCKRPMKGATAVLSATMLVPRFPKQLS